MRVVKRDYSLLLSLCILLLGFIVCVLINNRRYKDEIGAIYAENMEYRNYIMSQIRYPLSEDDRMALDFIDVKDDAKMRVLVPSGSCVACAMQLIKALSVYGLTTEDVQFYMAEMNMQIINELKIGGFFNYFVLDLPFPENVTNILIVRSDEESRYQVLKYYAEYPHVLKEYLNINK